MVEARLQSPANLLALLPRVFGPFLEGQERFDLCTRVNKPFGEGEEIMKPR